MRSGVEIINLLHAKEMQTVMVGDILLWTRIPWGTGVMMEVEVTNLLHAKETQTVRGTSGLNVTFTIYQTEDSWW